MQNRLNMFSKYGYCSLLLIAVSFSAVNSTPVPMPELPVVVDNFDHPKEPIIHVEPVAAEVAEPVRVERSPKPVLGLLHAALKTHHHHHHNHYRPHYGGGDYYGPSGGGFSGSGASASAFSGSQNLGYGGGGSNSHASAASHSLSFNTPLGGVSASSSFAQSNSNSFGGPGGYDW